jgi:hypothetical protein
MFHGHGVVVRRFTCGKYGIAEITSLACGKANQERELTGLGPAEIINYSRRVKFGVSRQSAMLVVSGDQAHHLEHALEGYIGSNMPVIVALDTGRMEGGPGGRIEEGIQVGGRRIDSPIVKGIGANLAPSPALRKHGIVIVGHGPVQQSPRASRNSTQLAAIVAPKTLRIVAFATFLPEITSHIPAKAEDALSALRFLFGLAQEVRDFRKGHGIRAIERVAGTSIDGGQPST